MIDELTVLIDKIILPNFLSVKEFSIEMNNIGKLTFYDVTYYIDYDGDVCYYRSFELREKTMQLFNMLGLSHSEQIYIWLQEH